MYYHARPLKYVECGKIYPNPTPDDDLVFCYRWIGNYCGFYPQVWLSRSTSWMTGYQNEKDKVLFCFDVLKGFPISYTVWERLMGALWPAELEGFDPVDDIKKVNALLNFQLHPSGLPEEFDDWLKENAFFKDDQVVVPSLNLKSAKEIHCRNEKQKKKLRKMGFIEDRIRIRNMPYGDRW
jgi:hypothetical protein